MPERICCRCSETPGKCRCESTTYRILLILSVIFPSAELAIGKFLANSSLVLLDALHALAHGAFFYLALRATNAVNGSHLSQFDKEAERKKYAAWQSLFLIGGMVIFLILYIFSQLSEPEKLSPFYTCIGALVGLAGAFLSYAVLKDFKRNHNTNHTYDIVEIHIHADIMTSLAPIGVAFLVWTGRKLSISNSELLDPLVTAVIALWFIKKSIPYLAAFRAK